MLCDTNINHTLTTDILSVILSVAMIHLANRNISTNRRKGKIYILTQFILICEFLMQITEMLLIGKIGTRFVVLNHILKTVSCLAAPCIIIGMYFIHNNKENSNKRNIKWIILPIIFNAVILSINLKYGFLYKINEYNIIVYGKAFILEWCLCAAYFIFLIISAFINDRNKTKNDIFLLSTIFMLPVVGAVLRPAADDDIIWLSMAISLSLYYTFLREEDFKKDILTGVYTRAMFFDELKGIYCDRSHESIHIGIFDLNNFKDINDTYGHHAGDNLLESAAKILDKAFGHFAKIYRIGGDEFCALAYNSNESEINRSISEMDMLIEEWNAKNEDKISVARGFCKCNADKFEDFMTYYNRADHYMYENKRQLKRDTEKDGKQYEKVR